jgi:DNA-binding MarR family transcriptional regulator
MRFFGMGHNNNNNLDASTNVELTDTGSKMAEKFDAVTPELRVLTALNQGGSAMTVSELASSTGIPVNSVKMIVGSLSKKKQVMILQ